MGNVKGGLGGSAQVALNRVNNNVRAAASSRNFERDYLNVIREHCQDISRMV